MDCINSLQNTGCDRFGNFMPNSDYIKCLPPELLNDIWGYLGTKDQSNLLETSKSTLKLGYGDLEIWNLTNATKKYFWRGYKDGVQPIKDDKLLGTILVGIIYVVAIEKFVGFNFFIAPVVSLVAGSLCYMATTKKMSDANAADFTRCFAALIYLTIIYNTDMLAPTISSAATFFTLLNLIGIIENPAISLPRSAVSTTICTLAVFSAEDYAATTGAIKATVIGFGSLLGIQFNSEKIAQSNIARKASGVAYGTRAGTREALSWGWNLGIPKVKRFIYNFKSSK